MFNNKQNTVISLQTKRDEPGSVVDYEKVDSDARVSRPT